MSNKAVESYSNQNDTPTRHLIVDLRCQSSTSVIYFQIKRSTTTKVLSRSSTVLVLPPTGVKVHYRPDCYSQLGKMVNGSIVFIDFQLVITTQLSLSGRHRPKRPSPIDPSWQSTSPSSTRRGKVSLFGKMRVGSPTGEKKRDGGGRG